VVTGGAQGIGRAIATRLADAGAHVHVFDRAGVAPDPLFGMHEVDVTDAPAIAAAIAALPEPPVLLVNNAGITRDRTIAKMSDEEWDTVLGVNLTGAFNMIRGCAPGMMAAGYGRIVNIASINGLRGKFGQANYAAAKAGMIGLTKVAAREFGAKGITVNALAPGMVLTDMAKTLPREVLDRAVAETVTGRLAEPEDVAEATLFLLSEGARSVTGQVLNVDCGQYM
jgi:acetoacetyl-CoA reductase/3-oxoacyl-[acyl-carrier protein] reductase